MVEEILYAPRNLRDELKRAKEELANARLDATASGAIRYDKDRVMSSASDDLLNNKVARIIEAEDRVKYAQIEMDYSKSQALQLINLIDNDIIREVCRRYFIEFCSCREIGYQLCFSAMTISNYKKKGIYEIKQRC